MTIIVAWLLNTWATLRGLHITIQIVLAFMGLLLFVFLIAAILELIRFFKSPNQYVEFFSDRSDVNRITRGIENELREPKRIWLLWHTATEAANRNVWKRKNIERLILLSANPQNEILQLHAGNFGKEVNKLREDIKDSTKTAQNEGIAVKWLSGSVPNPMVIANPIDKNNKTKGGWARIEILIHSPLAGERPGILIQQSMYPDLFKKLCDYYDEMWEKRSSEPS